MHTDEPRSFLGMVEVKEKVPDRCGGRGEGEGDRPLLHRILLIIKHSSLT